MSKSSKKKRGFLIHFILSSDDEGFNIEKENEMLKKLQEVQAKSEEKVEESIDDNPKAKKNMFSQDIFNQKAQQESKSECITHF
jgi:hypothetical protein